MPNTCRYCGADHDEVVMCLPLWRTIKRYTDPTMMFDASVSSGLARQQELADAVPALVRLLELMVDTGFGVSVESFLHLATAKALRDAAERCASEQPEAALAFRSVADMHERSARQV